jgi:translation initiation factor IF-3
VHIPISFNLLIFFIIFQLATEGSKNFAERNIYVILVPNKLAIQKEQDGLNKKVRAEGEVDQSEDESDADEAVIEQVEESDLDGAEPVIEQLEESKEPETEVSANV